MPFIITKDLFNQFSGGKDSHFKSRVGMIGPKDCFLSADDFVTAKIFRMLDADGEVYYEGRYVPNPVTGGEDLFEPLDCLGTPDAGCTTIQYREGGPTGPWKEI